jgi:hypothetical protein
VKKLKNKSNKDKCLFEETTRKKCKKQTKTEEIRKLKITEKAILALFSSSRILIDFQVAVEVSSDMEFICFSFRLLTYLISHRKLAQKTKFSNSKFPP